MTSDFAGRQPCACLGFEPGIAGSARNIRKKNDGDDKSPPSPTRKPARVRKPPCDVPQALC
ncbi:MAG: hypothetical protein NTX45_05990 [Proteobacteria bacterium]|nr:hypothetical protein [Pseudomonadota bacterium]